MIKVILFNGPPGSGKDTLAEFLEGNQVRFKDAIYDLASKVSGVPLVKVKYWCTDRKLKELPCPYFMAVGEDKLLARLTPRQYLIHLSENVCKPMFGPSFFGDISAKKLKPGLNVFSDSGFPEELRPIAEIADELVLVRLYRKGCSFEGDSRDYLSKEFVESLGGTVLDYHNDDTLEEAQKWVLKLLD